MDDIKMDLWAAIGLSDDCEVVIGEICYWVVSQVETFSKWCELLDFLWFFEYEFEIAGVVYDCLEHMF